MCDGTFHDSSRVRGGGILFAVNNALSTIVKFTHSCEYDQLDILISKYNIKTYNSLVYFPLYLHTISIWILLPYSEVI